jgi:two-component system chemotaxis sensor kinase CheA
MLRLPRRQIHRHEQTHFATFRNEVYPVLRLADHFACETPSEAIVWPDEVAMAIVQTDQEKIGVAVDRFVSDVEVIVKPLGRDFANISAFQGATILGDGRVALVINPAGFV